MPINTRMINWQTMGNTWHKLGQWDSSSLTSVLRLGLISAVRLEGRRERACRTFPCSSLLWHDGLGSNISHQVPFRRVFLDSTEYSCSKTEATRGEKCIQKNTGQDTQQDYVRNPSSMGVSSTVHATAVQVQGARKLPWLKSFLSQKNIISGNDATGTPHRVLARDMPVSTITALRETQGTASPPGLHNSPKPRAIFITRFSNIVNIPTFIRLPGQQWRS